MKPMMNVDNARPDTVNTAIRANLKNVIRWSTPVTVYATGSGAAVTFQHDLGVTPTALEVEPWVDTRWWADTDDQRIWSATSVTFRTAHAGNFTVRAGYQ